MIATTAALGLDLGPFIEAVQRGALAVVLIGVVFVLGYLVVTRS